jgi:tRNA1Val (adenine37-N6)-methyltransferase
VSDTTLDQPAPGVWICQPRRGFRYGAEAFWVTGFATEVGAPASAVDLGTGSGIMAALLARLGVGCTGFEQRPEWAACWAETRARTRTPAAFSLEQADISALPAVAAVDLVVANPPFFPAATGPVASDPWRRAARTESSATLQDFVATALGLLRPGGRAVLVVPRAREAEIVGPVRRVAQVGAVRSLVELVPGWLGAPERWSGAESDPRVIGWTRRFRELTPWP